MRNHLLDPRKYWVLERACRPQLTQNVTLVNDVGDPIICKSLKRWRPRRDLNPRLRRESGMAKRNSKKPQEHGRTGWRSRNSRKHLIVCPMCPRPHRAGRPGRSRAGHTQRRTSSTIRARPCPLQGCWARWTVCLVRWPTWPPPIVRVLTGRTLEGGGIQRQAVSTIRPSISCCRLAGR